MTFRIKFTAYRGGVMESNRKKIILVDDNITNLTIGKNILSEKYDVFTVPSGEKLLRILEKTIPDLILLDIEMPEMNGYEVINRIKSKESTASIPVIFLTAKGDPGSELEGLSLGAIDYIAKPFSPPLLAKRIEVHLLVESQKTELKNYNDNLQLMVKEKTKTVQELQNAVLKTMAELVECRDDITGGHIERTTSYLKILVGALLKQNVYREEVSSWDIDFFIQSAQLHDVGKIAIKDDILLKPSKLSEQEFAEMKNHTVFGMKVIQKIGESTTERTFLHHAEILAGSHHEKWNGTGYPLGLSGENIPLQGRLMAIADVYDALTNERPYKPAFSHEEAVRIIRNDSGTHFDPNLVNVFLAYEKAFESVSRKQR